MLKIYTSCSLIALSIAVSHMMKLVPEIIVPARCVSKGLNDPSLTHRAGKLTSAQRQNAGPPQDGKASMKGTGLIAYWPFDEGSGQLTKDAAGNNHLTLKQAEFVRHNKHGRWALEFDDRNSTGGSDVASLTYKAAKKGGLVFDRDSKFTVTAWVRGRADGNWGGLNDIMTMCRSGQSGKIKFADVRGWAFSIVNYRLRFSMISELDFRGKSNRLTVDSALKVRDDADFHHVAVTYDGTSKASGVHFYVDGVKNKEFSVNFETQGHNLTDSIAVECPLNIGGRNDDHKDLFHFGFSGYIDEVGVYRRVLSDGEVTAIFTLANEPKLAYNLKQADWLIDLHRNRKGSKQIDNRVWVPVPAGSLDSGVGALMRKEGDYYLQLAADGSGVRTKK